LSAFLGLTQNLGIINIFLPIERLKPRHQLTHGRSPVWVSNSC